MNNTPVYCGLCDSQNVVMKRKVRESRGDLKFVYTQFYNYCCDCEFSFVTDESSTLTIQNREECRENAVMMGVKN